jgi:hypothetical protein
MRFSGMDAALALPNGASAAKTAELPEHIDFALYSGSEEKEQADLGRSHGQ